MLDKHRTAQQGHREGRGRGPCPPLTLAQMFQQQNQLLFRAQVRAEHSHGQVMRPYPTFYPSDLWVCSILR